MAKLAYFIHGRGRGHASRSRPIVAALRAAGHEVQVVAGGDALDLIDGGANDDALRLVTPVKPGPAVGRRLLWRTMQDRRWLRSTRAALVITDGDAPGMHAAVTLGIPSIAVGHGLIFAYCRVPDDLPWRGRLTESVNAGSSAWLARRRVGVHFHPITPRDDRTHIARPDLDPRLIPAPPTEDRYVAYFRDGNGGPVLAAAVAAGLAVTCFGPCEGLPEGVEARPFDRDEFWRSLVLGRGLISSSGSNALTEAVALQRPVLAVHAPNDYEQAMNALLIQRAGLGEALALGGDPRAKVHRFADRCRRDQFTRFDLRNAMPPASKVVVETVDAIARIDGL